MAGIAAVVVAAGRGLRAGGDMPKQFRPIGGEPMIRPSLVMLLGHPNIALVQPVIHRSDVEMFTAAATGLDLLPPVYGGATRQASVRAGLEALERHAPEIVLVHDAARPFASAALASRAIAAAPSRPRARWIASRACSAASVSWDQVLVDAAAA